MAGRHEFVPTPPLSQTDCEEVSNYDHAAQLKAHHEMAIAGWNKPAGIHKREKTPMQPSNKLRKIAAATLSLVEHPRLGH
jgi:hypothetical protein